jgi:hypothetical protein
LPDGPASQNSSKSCACQSFVIPTLGEVEEGLHGPGTDVVAFLPGCESKNNNTPGETRAGTADFNSKKRKQSLVEFFRKSPLISAGVRLERTPDYGPKISFSKLKTCRKNQSHSQSKTI